MNEQTGVLIYDIEASSPKPDTAVPSIIGWWSTITNDYYWTTDLEVFQRAVDEHKFICGYNQINYDNTVLSRFGVSFKYKIQLDLMQIIHGKGFGNDLGRKSIMQTPDGTHLGKVCHGKSLKETSKALGCTQKMDFEDYDMFKVPFHTLSKEKQAIALEYLEYDVLATRDILRYCEDFFEDFKSGGVICDEDMEELEMGVVGQFLPFCTEEQIRKKQYLTQSVASWTYSAICNVTGLKVRFGDSEHMSYGGGFVAEPLQRLLPKKYLTDKRQREWKEFIDAGAVEGNIYCLDYNSLYPHIMIMMNLYGVSCDYSAFTNAEGLAEFSNVRPTTEDAIQGEKICTTDGYYSKTQSKVGALLRKLYGLRLEYKKVKDERQYTTKIIINTIYGLLGNSSFTSVSNVIAASDCTKLGRQWVNSGRLHLAESGYDVLYTDTDSIYVRDPFNDRERLMRCKDEHIEEIKKNCIFPVDTFDMGVDEEMSYMFFVGKDGHYIKKNYFYVKKDLGKGMGIGITGHPLSNSKGSALSKHIFNKYIKPELLSNTRDRGLRRHKWMRTEIEKWVEVELKQDLGLVSKFFKVKKAEDYESKTSLYYQFATSALYGEGSHHMIKLRVEHSKGAGSNRNYIGIEHKDTISVGMIDLNSVWNELAPFIQNEQKGLDSFF